MYSKYSVRWPSLFLSLMVTICASQLAKASSDSGTLTPATSTAIPCPPGFVGHLTFVGFESGNWGTYSPTGLTGGSIVNAITDETTNCLGPANLSLLSITGFSSDPGSTWLSSVTCGGVQKVPSSASYSYTSGTAVWTWGSKFGLSNGAQVSCTMVHS